MLLYSTFQRTSPVSAQLNMLEEGLLNHAAVGFSESGRKASELRKLLAKIEESEVRFLLVPHPLAHTIGFCCHHSSSIAYNGLHLLSLWNLLC